MGVFFGSTSMMPWIQTLIVNHLKDSSADGTCSREQEQELPHRSRLVQIVGRGGTWWQNPDVASPSCYLEITDGQHCIQVHLTPTCQASLREQHFQYADQCRQGCLVVIEQYTVHIQIQNNNGGIIALLAKHIQLKGGSETGICHPLEPIQDSVEVKRHLQQYKYKIYKNSMSQQQKDTADTNTNTSRPVVIGDVDDLFASTQGQDIMEQILQEVKRRQPEEEEKEEATSTRQEPQGDNNVAMLRVGNVQDLLDSQDVVMEQVLEEARRRLKTMQPEETEEENGQWRVPPVPRKLGNVQDLLRCPETLEAVLQLAETAVAAEQMVMEDDVDDDDDQKTVLRKQPQRLGGPPPPPPPTVPHWSESDDDDDEDDDDAIIGISKLLDSQPTQALESESTQLEHPEREVKIRGDWSESDDEGDQRQVSSTTQREPLASSNLPPSQRESQGMSVSIPTEPESTSDLPPTKRVSNQADSQDRDIALSTESEAPSTGPEEATPLNDNRRSRQRPPIPNYEAVGTTARSPSEKSDKENSSSEQKTIKAQASKPKPTAEKKKLKKRAAAPDQSSGTSKKRKRTTSLWQRLANNKATASLKTKIVTGVGGLSSWLSQNSK